MKSTDSVAIGWGAVACIRFGAGTRAGRVAHVGDHRPELSWLGGLWARTFERSVDYVVGWVCRYGPEIREVVAPSQRSKRLKWIIR